MENAAELRSSGDGDAIMTEYFEIIPGVSIGPFKLGMTREQIEELDIHPRIDLNKRNCVLPVGRHRRGRNPIKDHLLLP